MKKTVAAVFALLAGATQAQTFQARDFNGDGAVDAYYDSSQNLTWLADANAYASTGNAPERTFWGEVMAPGQMLYTTALTWVSSLNVFGVDDWRLPERLIPANYDPNMCDATSCYGRANTPSELSFLAIALAGTSGPFSNVQSGGYMTSAGFGNGTTVGLPVLEMRNVFTNTRQYTDETSLAYGYAWAVRDGDVANATATVAAVPEPGTYALMLAGLAAVGTAVHRRAQQQL